MDRLSEITFRLPATPESRGFLADLGTLLAGVAYAGLATDRLTLTPPLPSTADELRDGIRDFVVGREPRFELVHDQLATRTQWQFALWTDLTRTELSGCSPSRRGSRRPA
jgi:hypothetical protein